MRELIPSKDVRNYLQKIGREFNDFECATLIYNSNWSLNEKHQALAEILENTKDEVLRGQIKDRIERDKECIKKIKSMPGKLIIKLEVWEAMDSEYRFAGYFETFALAEGYASGCGRKCKIEVCELVNGIVWDEDNWGESEIAYVMYDEQGEIICYWAETCTETKDLECEHSFENAYVHIGHPFTQGDIVQIIGTEEIGIVRFYSNVEKLREMGETSGIIMDYSDVSITVEVLGESTKFVHRHISPIQLEYANLPNDDPRKEVLESASYLVTGQGYIQEFQMACEKYIERYEGSPQR